MLFSNPLCGLRFVTRRSQLPVASDYEGVNVSIDWTTLYTTANEPNHTFIVVLQLF